MRIYTGVSSLKIGFSGKILATVNILPGFRKLREVFDQLPDHKLVKNDCTLCNYSNVCQVAYSSLILAQDAGAVA